jgi:hypothetical protein
MAQFLHGARYIVLVVEQSDDGRAFNRGALLNVGFREIQKQATHLSSVILHDVDLLPSDGLLRWYREPPQAGQPVHRAGPTTWTKYATLGAYTDIFFGGVTALHPPDYAAANGYPNSYWGWGMEDDQLRMRVHASGGLDGGVVRPPPGAGTYDDLDNVAMLQLAQNLGSNGHMFNPLMFTDLEARGRLDVGWRHANGLRGVKYELRERSERRLSADAAFLHVKVHLAAAQR